MSETPPEPTPAQDPAPQPTQQPEKAPTDWEAEAKKWEKRAKENFEKAQKFDEVEEANKSEIEKAKERAEAAERRATQAEQVALKTRIAAEMNVPVEVLHGDDEESIKASAQRVLDWAGSNKKAPPKVPSLKSGATTPEPATGEKGKAAAAVRALRQG